MAEIPYNSNPEMVAMKQSIADRKFRVKITGMLITAGFALAALATVAAVPGSIGMIAAGGSAGLKLLTFGVLGAAGVATSLFTLKEVKKLELDEKYLESYMSGKNYWGEGYREEVAEHGYDIQAPAFHGAPPPPQRGPSRS